MERKPVFAVVAILLLSILSTPRLGAQAQNDDQLLLGVRASVWRAWFEGNLGLLKTLVPPGSIAINSGSKQWDTQAEILQSSADFHKSGAKLVRLEFPRTEVQHFGDVSVIYSDYLYETEQNGERQVHSGRATEVFVLRDGRWTNPGWHTDAGPRP